MVFRGCCQASNSAWPQCTHSFTCLHKCTELRPHDWRYHAPCCASLTTGPCRRRVQFVITLGNSCARSHLDWLEVRLRGRNCSVKRKSQQQAALARYAQMSWGRPTPVLMGYCIEARGSNNVLLAAQALHSACAARTLRRVSLQVLLPDMKSDDMVWSRVWPCTLLLYA